MTYKKVGQDWVAGDVINGDKVAGDKIAGNKVVISGKHPVKIVIEQSASDPVEEKILEFIGKYEMASPKSIADGTGLLVGDVYTCLINSEKFGERNGLFYKKPELG